LFHLFHVSFILSLFAFHIIRERLGHSLGRKKKEKKQEKKNKKKEYGSAWGTAWGVPTLQLVVFSKLPGSPWSAASEVPTLVFFFFVFFSLVFLHYPGVLGMYFGEFRL